MAGELAALVQRHGGVPLVAPALCEAPVDASGGGALELSLWRWLNSDYTPFMQNNIEVWDGAAWQTVAQTGGAPGVQEAAWNLQVYDITAFANANLQIRIGYNIDSGGVYTCSGWNVDDIQITRADCSLPACGADPVATALAVCATEYTNCALRENTNYMPNKLIMANYVNATVTNGIQRWDNWYMGETDPGGAAVRPNPPVIQGVN